MVFFQPQLLTDVDAAVYGIVQVNTTKPTIACEVLKHCLSNYCV
jgi:hypothetical protein